MDLHIPAGEFFALLGPSGCGKTTTLRIVAGLEQQTTGQVLIGGKDVSGTKPHERPVNTVFQSYALFPHMTILENVAFGLRQRKIEDPLKKAMDEAHLRQFLIVVSVMAALPVFDRLLHSSLVGVNLSKAQRGIAKARGVKPDLPDVNLDWPMGGFVGMRVELKAPLDLVPDAGPTDGQLEQIIVLRAAGFYCVVSYGWEDAAGHITRYMNGHIERITTTP